MLNWLESEKRKDDLEEQQSKKKIIAEIKTLDKQEIFKKKEKPSLWQKLKIIILGN